MCLCFFLPTFVVSKRKIPFYNADIVKLYISPVSLTFSAQLKIIGKSLTLLRHPIRNTNSTHPIDFKFKQLNLHF